MLKNWKSEKGYTGIDVAISIVILSISTLIIATIFANIYVQYTEAQRDSTAMAYLTSVSELIDKMYYQNVYTEAPVDPEDEDNLGARLIEMFGSNTTITRNSQTGELKATVSNSYNISIIISKHIPEGMQDSLDLVKNVNIEVSYNVGNAKKNIKIDKIKAKEILITPNKPQLPQEVISTVPVKFVITDMASGEGYWEITSEDDTTWYSYENKMWANIMVLQGLGVEGGLTVTEENKDLMIGKKVVNATPIFAWIPKFVVVNDEIVFLYSTSNNSIDSNGFLQKVNATPSNAFEGVTGFWVGLADYSTIENANQMTSSQKRVTISNITSAQKNAISYLSESIYGGNRLEFAQISNNRKVITVR